MIEPISAPEQALVESATLQCLRKANDLLDTSFDAIPVRFNLKGRSAGMYRVANGRREIRYNPYLFAKYFDENLKTTVPHEVAHYLTDAIYGYRNVRAHGHEWRTVMRMLEADATVHCDFDLDGIPVRQYRKIRYSCLCRHHDLTKVRHNRIQEKGMRYFCRVCRAELMLAAPP